MRHGSEEQLQQTGETRDGGGEKLAMSLHPERKMLVLMTADAVGGVWNYCVRLAQALGHYDVRIALADRDRLLDSAWPKMAFVEHSLEGDPTNWWVPNQAAVEALLRSCGWQSVRSLGEEIYHCGARSAGLPLSLSIVSHQPSIEKENHLGQVHAR
jgi:hypothetical protein